MKKRILMLVALLATTVCVNAQDLESILKKHFDAVGQDKLVKVNSMKMKATMNTQGLTMQADIIVKKPNKTRTEIDMGTGQKMIMSYDGTTAWTINPALGDQAQELPAGQAASMISQADMDGALWNYKKKGHQVEYIGEEQVDGIKYYKLKVLLKEQPNAETVWYINANTYLIDFQNVKVNQYGTIVEARNIMAAYKNVEGVMLPSKFITEANGVEQLSMTMSDIQLNVDVDD
ncbi:MAG: hypothetical protein AAFX87_22270, partial [Bacteroidota bacterium]